MENYEEKYKQALERARKVYIPIKNNILDDIFPELAESEDERIRKKLICFVENWKKAYNPNSPFDDFAVYTSSSDECDKILAWLEKQGKKLDADYVIEWLDKNAPKWLYDMTYPARFDVDTEDLVKQFKKDFGL